MRYLLCLALLSAVSLPAQTPESDRSTLQTLLSEVQQLRVAIERSTLLGARTQIAINLMQAQQSRVERLAQELDKTRKDLVDMQAEKPKTAARAKMFEESISTTTDPQARKDMEQALSLYKIDIEQFAAREQDRRAREAELNTQLLAEQGRLADLQGRIADMERLLDQAIQITIVTGKTGAR